MQREPNIVKIIVDIKVPVKILADMISDHIYEGEYLQELKSKIIAYSCQSFLAYIQQEKSELGNSLESMDKAIHYLMDHQLPMTLSSEIFNQTENAIIRSLMNVIPEIDDERKYKILNHEVLYGDALLLTLEVMDD